MLTLHLMQPTLVAPFHSPRSQLWVVADHATLAPPPPELGEPDSPPPSVGRPARAFLSAKPVRVERHGDPLAGSAAGRDVGAAIGGLMIGHALALGAGMIVGSVGAAIEGKADEIIPPSAVAEMLTSFAAELVVVPLWASLGIKWWAPGPFAGSLGRAWLRAGLVHLGALALLTAGINASESQHEQVAAIPCLALAAMTEFAGVPFAASWGMHDGPEVPRASPAQSIRSELPPRVSLDWRPPAAALAFSF